MSELINRVEFILGDWSHDGHGQTETISIMSNLNRKQIEKAYKKGSKLIDLDIVENLCCDYEDCSVSTDIVVKLKTAGYNLSEWVFDPTGEDDATIDSDEFLEIYLFITKKGNPIFEYKITRSDAIEIGGYGLFSN